MTRASVAIVVALSALASACSDDSATGSTSGSTASGTGGAESTVASASVGTSCPVCGDVRDAATVADPAIIEASGIAVSTEHEGVVYVHNDSGDTARFFAVGKRGESLGTYDVEGATAHDWEDMDRGPCAGSGSCLYLADIGDNSASATMHTINRVAEPAELAAGTHSVTAETFAFGYPDGPHNAEAILVHPTTGVVTIVSKALGGSNAYELGAPLTANMVATKVGAVSAPMLSLVTGGSVRSDGKAVLLRTYGAVLYYAVPDGASVAQALASPPCELPAPDEPQGEAITFDVSGSGYLTISEGAKPHIYAVDCQ